MQASFRNLNLLLFVLCINILPSCGTKATSDRDNRRNQNRVNAESKRAELQLVVGEYYGTLTQTEAGIRDQNISLHLTTKDVPVKEEGSIDPVMIPKLTGHFRFDYGSSADGIEDEYIGFSVDQAEYDKNNKKISLIVSNEKYKDIYLEILTKGTELKGTWSAPSISSSGNIQLKKKVDIGTDEYSSRGHRLRNVYKGVLNWDQMTVYQYTKFTISTKELPPNGLALSASARIYFGDWNSTEFISVNFEQVEFNPINGQMVFKNPEGDVWFVGTYGKGKIDGKWYTNINGVMGKMMLTEGEDLPISAYQKLIDPLMGTYRGKIENTNPNTNLPENIMIGIVTGIDLNGSEKINITGNIRFYLGSFESMDYQELPLSNIHFNFLTREFMASTSGNYQFTIKAKLEASTMVGKIFHDGLGEVAKFGIKKL